MRTKYGTTTLGTTTRRVVGTKLFAMLAVAGMLGLGVGWSGCGGSDNQPIPVITGPTGPTGFGSSAGLTTTTNKGGGSHP